jgi:ribosome-binding ATPase YchF (GTP1/OBG family)
LYNKIIASLKLQAEKLLKKLYATKNLRDATVARKLAALEKAIDAVKKGGWEKDLQREIREANTLLEKVSINLFKTVFFSRISNMIIFMYYTIPCTPQLCNIPVSSRNSYHSLLSSFSIASSS